MKKPFAYITAVWKGGEFTVIDQAAVYCRKVYEAGFTPICPVLYLPHFLRDSIPAEYKAVSYTHLDVYKRQVVHINSSFGFVLSSV